MKRGLKPRDYSMMIDDIQFIAGKCRQTGILQNDAEE
jgi:hypothetical protein